MHKYFAHLWCFDITGTWLVYVFYTCVCTHSKTAGGRIDTIQYQFAEEQRCCMGLMVSSFASHKTKPFVKFPRRQAASSPTKRGISQLHFRNAKLLRRSSVTKGTAALLKADHSKPGRWQRRRTPPPPKKKKRHVKAHSFLQRLCQNIKVCAVGVFQNLAVLHIRQLHVPAEDLRWRAVLLAKGGFWSGAFDWVERIRWESSVWSRKLLRDG